MSSLSYRSSRPDSWSVPRPYSDACTRFRANGPIQPREEPSFLDRLFGRA